MRTDLRLRLWLSIIFLMFGQVAAGATGISALDRIRQHGTITVAMFAEDVPPFFYEDERGDLVGIDPSLARDIAAKLGVDLVYNRVARTFDDVIEEVAAGRADIAISLLSDTLERAMRVSFSRSYVSVRQFMLINRLELARIISARRTVDGASMPALLNSPSARIGVIGGTSYVGFLKEDFPEATAVEFDDWSTMLGAIKSGQIVALMYDEIEIGNWRLEDSAGSLELRPLQLVGHPDTIAIALGRNDPDLKIWIDLYLSKIEGSGFLRSILDTYLYSTDRMLAND